MPHPPSDYHICPSCGTEFGLDDDLVTHEELRNRWLSAGAPWFSRFDGYQEPCDWNPWDQLDRAGYEYRVLRPLHSIANEISQDLYAEHNSLSAGFDLDAPTSNLRGQSTALYAEPSLCTG